MDKLGAQLDNLDDLTNFTELIASYSSISPSTAIGANGTSPLLPTSSTAHNSSSSLLASDVSFEFLVHGVLNFLIGVLGLLGNVICIVILSRPQMKSSINTLLIGLVSCDSLLIVTSILLFSFTGFKHTGVAFFHLYQDRIYPYILPVVYPIAMAAQTGSAYMTLMVTIERYLVVCWPLKARSVCTNGRAKLAVLLVLTFAVIYNIPRFLEVTWEEESDGRGGNRTVYTPTELRKNPHYISVYITSMYLVFMYAVPFGGLSVLNMLMFLDVR